MEGEAVFSFELDNGTKLEGSLLDGVLPIRALGKGWKIPEYHVLKYVWPKATEAGTSAPETPAPPATEEKPTPPAAAQDPFGPPQPASPAGEADPFGTPPLPAAAPTAPAGADPFGGRNPFGSWTVQPAGMNA